MSALLNPFFFNRTTQTMPAMFVGHGSPMNGISNNLFTNKWVEMGASIPQPVMVLCISAHWLTRGTHVTAMNNPRTIHDFGGFPKELYQVQYPAKGDSNAANDIKNIISEPVIQLDHEWGLDHGCWTILTHMYPKANIPVLQLSIDISKPAQYHYNLAKQLNKLRNKGVLIIGSGNMVHNLSMIAWHKMDDFNYSYDWAIEANETFKQLIEKKEHTKLNNYQNLGAAVKIAIPSPDHFLPLVYITALQNSNDNTQFFNDNYVAGSLSMTSLLLSEL